MILPRNFGKLLLIVAPMLIVSVLTVGQVAAKELAAIEQRLLADAADASLDDFSLLEAALVASGITDRQQVERYRHEFATRIEPLLFIGRDKSSATPDLERFHDFLHGEFLTGNYRSSCTEIDRALDNGDYNCVTATILYHCVCSAGGLDPVAVATSTHVRSRLLTDPVFDVETTCRDWFDVVRRDPQRQVFRSQQQNTRQLSHIQLLAKIYYNRGVSLLENGTFGEAITLLGISQLFDPADEPTRENLAAGLNNWALAECDAGNFERAVALIQQARDQHPGFTPLLANDVHIHHRWAVLLCEEARFGEAMQVLHAAYIRRPEVALFDRGRLVVYGQWAASLLARGDIDSARRLFEQAGNWFDQPSDLQYCRTAVMQAPGPTFASPGA